MSNIVEFPTKQKEVERLTIQEIEEFIDTMDGAISLMPALPRDALESLCKLNAEFAKRLLKEVFINMTEKLDVLDKEEE